MVWEADALSDEAILKVFEAKGREYHKPISIAVSDPDMIGAVAYVDEMAEQFIEEFLPVRSPSSFLHEIFYHQGLPPGRKRLESGIRIMRWPLN